MVNIPLSQLSEQALRGIVEAFVLREGTDYGPEVYSLADKCERVRDQLRKGEAELCFDPVTNTIDIRPS